MNPTKYLLVAMVVLALVLYFTREHYSLEFNDYTQEKKTRATEDSSYSQQTNHMHFAPADMGPIQGMQTPFQVNQYKAYVP